MDTIPNRFPSPLNIQKSMARAYLSANRLEEGVNLLAKIVQSHPEDWESLLILGDLYLAAEETGVAYHLYKRAEKAQPDHPEILRRLQLVENEPNVIPNLPADPPTHPATLRRLLNRLTGKPNLADEPATQKAADLLETILQSEQPAKTVAEHLDEIEYLLPALIELNLQQARQEGKIELASSLESLRQKVAPLISRAGDNADSLLSRQARILLLAPANPPSQERALVIQRALEVGGFQVEVNSELSADDIEDLDAAIAVNPHTSPTTLTNLARCASARRPVVLDLTCNVEQIPLKHPYYSILGLGMLEAGRAYNASLWLADIITVTSKVHAATLEGTGRRIQVMPEGWSDQNPMWKKKAPPHTTLHLGWVGSCSEVEDLVTIRRIILRVLREFPQTRLVLMDNPEAYTLFSGLPPERCLYLPATSAEDLPYQLGLIDVLLLPHRNIPFNQSLSERLLIYAGVKGIPWIASPLPAYLEWGAGGFIASTPEEWHTYLRQLIVEAEVRRQLGHAGAAQAALRESRHLAIWWKTLIGNLLLAPDRTQTPLPTPANPLTLGLR